MTETLSWQVGQPRFRRPGRACTDKRGRAYKRLKTAKQSLFAELEVAEADLPASDRIVIDALAVAMCELASVKDARVAGVAVTNEEMTRTHAALRRARRDFIALKERLHAAKNKTPSLQDYLAARAAERAQAAKSSTPQSDSGQSVSPASDSPARDMGHTE